MRRIYSASLEIKNAKRLVLARLCQAASIIKSGQVTEYDREFFHTALCRVSYDSEEHILLELADEAEKLINKLAESML